MYRNTRQWNRIRTRILVHEESRRHVAKTEGMSRNTVRKILKYAHPPGYRSSVRSKAASRQATQTRCSVPQTKIRRDKQYWMEWLYSLEQQHRSHSDSEPLANFNMIFDVLSPSPNCPRTKALVVLAKLEGFSGRQIAKHLAIAVGTVRGYLSAFQTGGEEGLFRRKMKQRKSKDQSLKNCIFTLLHEPPCLHGINRTTWRMADLREILKKYGHSVGLDIIRTIIKEAGSRQLSWPVGVNYLGR